MSAAHVYFLKPIGLDGPIKIGHSMNPKSRLETLAIWSPWPLEIIGSVPGRIQDEQYLHRCFLDCHSHYEWFRSTPLLRHTIATIIAAGRVDPAQLSLTEKGSVRKKTRRVINLTPARRLYLSWAARIRAAERRLYGDPERRHHAPADVQAIINAWSGNRYMNIKQRDPTLAEIARLEDFLANAAAQCVTHETLYPETRKRGAA